jgi:O-antigen/teichoic acid export membrane protein
MEGGLLNNLFAPSRLRRDIVWNVISLGMLGASGMVINSIILGARGAEDLGSFNQVFGIYIVVSQIAVGGVQFSTLKHCSYAQNNVAECSQITSSGLMLVSGIALPICAALYFLSGFIGGILESPSVALGINYALPGLFFFALNKVIIMALNGLRRMRAFAVFQSLRYVLILSGVILGVALDWPGYKLPLSLTISEVILFLVLIAYLHAELFQIESSFSKGIRNRFRQHISFGTRGFLSGVLTELNTRVDVLMVGYFMSDMWVGVYSFGAIFAEGFGQLCIVVRQNLDPLIGHAFAVGRKEQITELAGKVHKRFWPLIGIFGAGLIAGFPLLVWLLSPEPTIWQSWGVFAILVTGVAISAKYRPFMGLLIQGGRPGIYTLLMAGSVLANGALNLCLIPWVGILGAAAGTAAVYVLEVIAMALLAKRLFGISL